MNESREGVLYLAIPPTYFDNSDESWLVLSEWNLTVLRI
jgi:hypothetical protein